jgi:hypothetical protein
VNFYYFFLNVISHQACWFVGRICLRPTASGCTGHHEE